MTAPTLPASPASIDLVMQDLCALMGRVDEARVTRAEARNRLDTDFSDEANAEMRRLTEAQIAAENLLSTAAVHAVPTILAALAAPPTPRGEEGEARHAAGPSFIADRDWPDCLDGNASHNRRAVGGENFPYLRRVPTKQESLAMAIEPDAFAKNDFWQESQSLRGRAMSEAAMILASREALSTPRAEIGGDARANFRAAMVDAARARGGAGAEFISKGETNLWLDIAYDAFAALAATRDAASVTPDAGEELLAVFKFIDNLAGDMNGVVNEPNEGDKDPDVIAIDLADALGIPFDECWPENAVAALTPASHAENAE
jgi:hypothetical protein